MFNPKNRRYLTKEVNAIFSEIPALSRDSKGQKKDAPDKKSDASSMVDRKSGISNQFIDDLWAVMRFNVY